MAVTREHLENLRSGTQLSSVIAPTVKLIRVGREWKGCCPFHKEKTPSFVVNDEKGFYHCFGCGAHGDAISFLTKAGGLSFNAAVAELSAAHRVMKLSSGQRECLLLVAEHLSSKEIAVRLGISPHTVDQRIRSSLDILGLDRRGEAASLVVHWSTSASETTDPNEAGRPKDAKEQTSGLPAPSPIGSAKRGGAKLARSETVTVRLDPKLNYLCELAARAQRRTKSSFIEWSIADSLGSVTLPEVTRHGSSYDEGCDVSLKEKASELWHVDEPDRLVALALIAPALLSHEEQLIWRVVRENGNVWKGHYNNQDEWSWTVSEESLIRERLRDNWEVFKAVALGDLPKDKLPKWQKWRGKELAEGLDDDVPF